MKEYHLKRLNDQLRALAIILVMPLLFGVLAIRAAWTDPFWGKAGLILAVLSLLGMIISYFNIYKNYILKIGNDTLTISNKKGTKEKKYNINDIALIQYNKSTDAVSILINYIKNLLHKGVESPWGETILIFSNTGQGIFVCSNGDNPTEFSRFFSDIRNRINAKEKFIYGKELTKTMGVAYRYLYINPLYENSRVVKKKTRQSGFYYGLIFLLSIFIPLIIAVNLWIIFPYLPKSFKYEGISFQHERNWKIKTDEITKGKIYYIGGEEDKDRPNIIVITISKDTCEESPQEYIENYLKDIERTKPESEIKTIETGKFGDYDCVLAKYSYRVEERNYYAVIYAFNTNNKSISIIKQSGRSAGLRLDFKLIEETFKVK
jgi:hypothetical protein